LRPFYFCLPFQAQKLALVTELHGPARALGGPREPAREIGGHTNGRELGRELYGLAREPGEHYRLGGRPQEQYCPSCNQKKPLIYSGWFLTCDASRQRNKRANQARHRTRLY